MVMQTTTKTLNVLHYHKNMNTPEKNLTKTYKIFKKHDKHAEWPL